MSMTSTKSKKWLKNWKSGFISHNIQQDGSSCGVHVIEVKYLYDKQVFTKQAIKILLTVLF